jgi:hypothetical protein
MLEILLLVYLCRKLGEMLRAKGRSAGWFQFLLAVAWFAGEFMGAVLLAILAGMGGAALYLGALLGAAAGVTAVFIVAHSLAPANTGGPAGFSVVPPARAADHSEL